MARTNLTEAKPSAEARQRIACSLRQATAVADLLTISADQRVEEETLVEAGMLISQLLPSANELLAGSAT